MAKVIIFGTKEMAELAHYYLSNDSEHEIIAFTVDKANKDTDNYLGLPVIPFEDITDYYMPDCCQIFLAMGYSKVNQAKAEKYFQIKEKGFELISYISSKAIVANNIKVGENCFILEGSIIQPFVNIGNNVTIWSGAHIGHHSEIQDHCFIAPKAALSGRVIIKPYCFIGLNSTIRDHVIVEEKSVIGAGVTILSDTGKGSVYKSNDSILLNINSAALNNI